MPQCALFNREETPHFLFEFWEILGKSVIFMTILLATYLI